jgi:hypothetical protein
MQGARVRPTIPASVKTSWDYPTNILGIYMVCERRSMIKQFLAYAGNIYAVLIEEKNVNLLLFTALSLWSGLSLSLLGINLGPHAAQYV